MSTLKTVCIHVLFCILDNSIFILNIIVCVIPKDNDKSEVSVDGVVGELRGVNFNEDVENEEIVTFDMVTACEILSTESFDTNVLEGGTIAPGLADRTLLVGYGSITNSTPLAPAVTYYPKDWSGELSDLANLSFPYAGIVYDSIELTLVVSKPPTVVGSIIMCAAAGDPIGAASASVNAMTGQMASYWEHVMVHNGTDGQRQCMTLPWLSYKPYASPQAKQWTVTLSTLVDFENVQENGGAFSINWRLFAKLNNPRFVLPTPFSASAESDPNDVRPLGSVNNNVDTDKRPISIKMYNNDKNPPANYPVTSSMAAVFERPFIRQIKKLTTPMTFNFDMRYAPVAGGSGYLPSPTAVLAHLFQFCRADIVVTLEIYGSPFEEQFMSLRYVPDKKVTDTTNDQTNNNTMTQLIQVSGPTIASFRIPYTNRNYVAEPEDAPFGFFTLTQDGEGHSINDFVPTVIVWISYENVRVAFPIVPTAPLPKMYGSAEYNPKEMKDAYPPKPFNEKLTAIPMLDTVCAGDFCDDFSDLVRVKTECGRYTYGSSSYEARRFVDTRGAYQFTGRTSVLNTNLPSGNSKPNYMDILLTLFQVYSGGMDLLLNTYKGGNNAASLQSNHMRWQLMNTLSYDNTMPYLQCNEVNPCLELNWPMYMRYPYKYAHNPADSLDMHVDTDVVVTADSFYFVDFMIGAAADFSFGLLQAPGYYLAWPFVD